MPLEFFSDFIDAFTLEDEPLTVIGYSKGAELALNLTNYYSTIENLILYTPGEYSYMGLEFSEESGSSWTWQGEELPYISFDDASGWSLTKMMVDMLIARPVEYRETYETAVKKTQIFKTLLALILQIFLVKYFYLLGEKMLCGKRI